MSEQPQIRFEDGAAYESFMGIWSRSVGQQFLDWVKPEPGLDWIDVGCGNGAFTELLVERCKPARVLGFDPSPAQLTYARERHKAGVATFVEGDAMAISAEDKSFDAAVMALVIFFVPQPAKGVAEMVRVVRPGGVISAYAWDILGGGFPLHVIQEEMESMGLPPLLPPSAEASRMDNLRGLWTEAGLTGVETREIIVERTFGNFEELWSISQSGPRLSQLLKGLTPEAREVLREKVRLRLPAGGSGAITTGARAHAVKGRVPA